MKLSAEVTLAIVPRNPASVSSAMTPSDTPPDRRVSSTMSTRPVSSASASSCSAGSGASQRRSKTRTPAPAAASRRATRSDIGTPFPKVTRVRSVPRP